MNKQQAMYKKIEFHGAQLNEIFNTQLDNIALCKKLRKIQSRVENAAVYHCNGAMDSNKWDIISDRALEALENVLSFRRAGIKVFINSDPRGYAFKIDDKDMREKNISLYRDMGGYGILAPDFREPS